MSTDKDRTPSDAGSGLRISIPRNDSEHLLTKRPLTKKFSSADDPEVAPMQYDIGNVKVHPLFNEMMEYKGHEWLETARWVKYEEIVEEGSRRWSKPHVTTPSLVSLLRLTACLNDALVLLDVDVDTFDDVVELVNTELLKTGALSTDEAVILADMLTHPKRHQYDQVAKVETKSLFTKSFGTKTTGKQRGVSVSSETSNFDDFQIRRQKQHYMRKLPSQSEATNILVGGTEMLEKHICAFIRLRETILLPELTEVPVPSRFIFLLVGPKSTMDSDYHEVGQAMATTMSDEVFAKVPYGCQSKEELVVGLDVFLDATTVLPPSTWNPEIRINPVSVPANVSLEEDSNEDGEGAGHGNDPALARTGRLFGGFIADIKRKAPWYVSDWTDGLNMQCVASFFFMYFAVLSPVVTFGGLLADSTGNNMAAMENALGALICGVSWHVLSGQPLCILGPTGPILVCEMICYELCKTMDINYLPFRFWINFWMALIMLIIVATDASCVIKYITRFTEESFATLIAVIFVVKALQELNHIRVDSIDYVAFSPDNTTETCLCVGNGTVTQDIWDKLKPDDLIFANESNWMPRTFTTVDNITMWVPPIIDYAQVPLNKCKRFGGHVVGDACAKMHNVFFMSMVLTIGTYVLATTLKGFRHKFYFPAGVRKFIADFSTTLAIFAMALLDFYVGIDTPKLLVPEEIRPTNPERKTWLVNPLLNPVWTIPVALVPAFFISVLIFMDQQITTVIVSRQENKLRKGAGYHLDLVVISAQLLITGWLGFPVFVAATVRSMNHVNSLKITGEANIPGDVPSFEGCREQRLTGTLTSIAVGMSVFLAPLLKRIPMPVLYGVFLYMGISALDGIQLVDRMLLMLMPMKYQPDYAYLRHVNVARVHLFTLVQTSMLAILWLVKSTKSIAIGFPLMLIVMVIVRSLMQFVFTKKELSNLDDQMPELFARMKEDHIKKKKELLEATTDKKNEPRRMSLAVEQQPKGGSRRFSVGVTTMMPKLTKRNKSQQNLGNMGIGQDELNRLIALSENEEREREEEKDTK